MDYQIKQMIGDEKTHRYVLASRCTKPLVVIGVNPSTANEKHPDPTVRKVMGFAELNLRWFCYVKSICSEVYKFQRCT